MKEVIIGLFTIAIGFVFCIAGYKMMRILFPIWGIIAGFWLGAGLVHVVAGDQFIGTALGIIVGIAFAIVGAAIAYLYYGVAVLLFMGSVGFWLGAGIASLFNFRTGLLSILLGSFFAVVFFVAGILGNAPKTFLILATSFAGAAAGVAGFLLVVGTASLEEFEDGSIHVALDHGTIWSVAVLLTAIFGIVAQNATTKDQTYGAEEWKKPAPSA